MCFGALYFTEMLHIIIINCFQWLSAVLLMGMSFNISNSIICELLLVF